MSASVTDVASTDGTGGSPDRAPRADSVTPGLRRGAGPLPAIAVMSLGVLLIALADAAGRGGTTSWAWVAAFWLGELMVFVPVIARLLRRGPVRGGEALALVVSLATATYLIKYAYSPVQFGFPDELQHLRTAAGILGQGHLFGVNDLLPVSPRFPGLELVTTAVVSVTGVSVFVAGLIVAGVSHLLFTASLYLMLRGISARTRVAGLACAVYATGPHFQVFDSIFGYQTLALAFFGMTLLATRHLVDTTGRRRICWAGLTLAAGVATVVTHHVTSLVLIGMLALLGVVELMHRRRGGSRWHLPAPLAAALVLAGAATAWLLLVAPITIGYLRPVLDNTVRGLIGGSGGSTSGAPSGPLADTLAGYAAAGLIMLLLPAGYVFLWRRRREVWPVALGIASLGYYVLTLLRLTSPGGAELFGRGSTFVYLPVGYVLAIAAVGLMRGIRRPSPGARAGRWRALTRRVAAGVRAVPARVVRSLAALAAVALFLGGLAGGWPPYWERLPGHYVVDGFESGITPEGLAAARWARTALGPGNRVAADFTNYLLLGSYGDQDVVNGMGQVYYTRRLTAADFALLRHQQISYLVVDLRMSRDKPPAEGYFPGRPAVCPCEAPIPRANLLKFARVPGVTRIYDSGNIIIFDLRGAHRAP